MLSALIAVIATAAGQLAGFAGVDRSAAVYRADSFARHGFELWSLSWFGGHFSLDYSVIYPPLAAWLGVSLLAVASAGLAAWGFETLAMGHFPVSGRAASTVFALGTLQQSAIGQMPFLSGEAFGLAALAAGYRGHRLAAAMLGVMASLTSPLAGAFVALAWASWGLASLWRTKDLAQAARRAAWALPPGLVVLASQLAFPSGGFMPYPLVDWGFEMAVAIGLGLGAAFLKEWVLLSGAALWSATATVAVVVPSALGGNVGRLEDAVALPLAVAFLCLWGRSKLLLAALGWPLLLSQWLPAWAAMTSASSQPSTHRFFYAPLDAELLALSRQLPAGRVEVVPTRYHWEATWVAPVMPLARGWERQLDERYDQLFYRPGALTPLSYQDWLYGQGVILVALPKAPLDPAGVAEARLLLSGRAADLKPIWSDAHWRLWELEGSTGLVQGPATLTHEGGQSLDLRVWGPGRITLRVHPNPYWRLEGEGACLTRSPSGQWLELVATVPTHVRLWVSLLGSSPGCPAPQRTLVAASGRGR